MVDTNRLLVELQLCNLTYHRDKDFRYLISKLLNRSILPFVLTLLAYNLCQPTLRSNKCCPDMEHTILVHSPTNYSVTFPLCNRS
jgi:hypothetical protein